MHKLRSSSHILSNHILTKILMLGALLFSAFAYSQSPNNQLRGGEIQSFDEHTYGKVEVRMYTQRVVGTTSTFFWWRNGGHECGTQWGELDIETIPVRSQYQSNPIWQTSDNDCQIKRSEELHGNADIYDRWVVYTLEWTPDYVAWYRDGELDRRITLSNHPSVQYLNHAMRYCFNLWTQGRANPDWLGNLDFNSLESTPVYQYVDYFRFYAYNGSGFNNNPTTNINFSSRSELDDNFAISNWEFGQSMGYLSWSKDAVGVANLSDGNGVLWLGLFHNGDERAPRASELPAAGGGDGGGNGGGVNALTIEAETASNYNKLRISPRGLGYIQNGAWASYSAVNIASSGQYDVKFRASSGGNGGSIQLERSGGGTVFGNVDVPATGGWGNYVDVSTRVTLPSGNINFGLYFADGGFNLDRFSISKVEAAQTIQAESAAQTSGLRVNAQSLGYISNGAWASYQNVNISSAGRYRITYRVASNGDGGSILLEQAGGATQYGTVTFGSTGGWSRWTNVSHTVNLPAGRLNLGLYFADGGFNLDRFTMTKMN